MSRNIGDRAVKLNIRGEKYCKGCDTRKPLISFYKTTNKTAPYGVRSRCKECYHVQCELAKARREERVRNESESRIKTNGGNANPQEQLPVNYTR